VLRNAARRPSIAFALRAGACLGLTGLFLFGTSNSLQTAVAEGDTRTISFHHLHTNEDITITYKRDGRYDDAALKKLDWFMRDWRRNESTSMDPHLFDLLWEASREVGASEPIQVVCGYRSPETNAMLRARSTGVAQLSQHTQGHAMDFFIPGVPLEKIREVGLRLQRGGVGFYPTSGSPFVHLDTGTIRHWPRMTHDQLAKVFPDGRTVHVPSDGVPLPGYALALADVERRGGMPSALSLAAARDNGIDVASAETNASANKPQRSLFAMLFGGGKDADADEASEEAAAKPASAPRRAPVVVASVTPPKAVAVEKIVPLPAARPKAIAVALAAAPVVVASATTTGFDNRASWRGGIEIGEDLSPPQPGSPFEVASADVTGTAALAYAPATEAPAPVRARPMGMARLAAAPITVAPPALAGGMSFDGPWLRAAMLTPSVSGFMTATQVGALDLKPLQELFRKPAQALAMTFSADPHQGMTDDRFSGSAVVFLATAAFAAQKTAALR
jgi:uncharacterized protein YcbK (DUF882 family)